MTLDLAADSAVFVTDFGEPVRFRTDIRAAPREITANVNRQPVADASETPFAGQQRPVIHVMARNHASLGVVPSEVQNDVSEIEVAYPLGGITRWRRVLRIVRHNAGAVLIEVQS